MAGGGLARRPFGGHIGCPWQAEDAGGWGPGQKRSRAAEIKSTSKSKDGDTGEEIQVLGEADYSWGTMSRVGSQTLNPADPALSVLLEHKPNAGRILKAAMSPEAPASI